MTPTTTHRPRRLRSASIAAIAAFSLIAAACGSDDDAEPVATEAPADEEAMEEEAMDEEAMEEEAMEEEAMDEEAMEEEAMEDEAMDEEAMEEEAMEDEAMEDDGLDGIRSELSAAGLTDDQVSCVVDAAVTEWGADMLVAEGQASDDELLRLGEITFGCL